MWGQGRTGVCLTGGRGAMLESGPTTTNVREKNDRWHASNSPRVSGPVSVELTRTELVALREMIEVTPRFSGRDEIRTAIRNVLAGRRSRPLPLCVEESSLAALARTIVPVDVPTATLRSKLERAFTSASDSGVAVVPDPAAHARCRS